MIPKVSRCTVDMLNPHIYRRGGYLLPLMLEIWLEKLFLNRVGGGVSPAASRTTGHTVPYHGGSC